MLTVKQIWQNGNETVYPARSVRYDIGSDRQAGEPGPTVWIEAPIGEGQGGETPHQFGTFYVMNDNGKTVASYYLDGPETQPKMTATEARAARRLAGHYDD